MKNRHLNSAQHRDANVKGSWRNKHNICTITIKSIYLVPDFSALWAPASLSLAWKKTLNHIKKPSEAARPQGDQLPRRAVFTSLTFNFKCSFCTKWSSVTNQQVQRPTRQKSTTAGVYKAPIWTSGFLFYSETVVWFSLVIWFDAGQLFAVVQMDTKSSDTQVTAYPVQEPWNAC